jgi:pyridoxal phosphate enzyme (YggS family)
MKIQDPLTESPHSSLATRVVALNKTIQSICRESNRDPSSLKILAVSKTKSIQEIESAYHCGLRYFAENYAQELEHKQRDLKNLRDIQWSFIGKIQSNKIKSIAMSAHEIQSICELRHAKALQSIVSTQSDKKYPIWILTNPENEPSKSGVRLEETPVFAAQIKEHCPNLSIQGLMCIPSPSYHDEAFPDGPPQLYIRLREVSRSIGSGLLSLGMSSDIKIAIQAGTDIIRIGSTIFGPRT